MFVSRGTHKSARSWDTTEYTIYRYTLHGLFWFHWKHSLSTITASWGHCMQIKVSSFYTEKKRNPSSHFNPFFFRALLHINVRYFAEGKIYWKNFHNWFIANFSGDNVEISIISLTYSVLSVISCLILEVKAFFTIC